MKTHLLLTTFLFIANLGFSQHSNYWKQSSKISSSQQIQVSQTFNDAPRTFELDLSAFKQALKRAPLRESVSRGSDLIMSFPNPEGILERFQVIEAPVMHPELEARYPGIKSFAGQGIDNPSATIRFSVSSQQGLHAMVLSGKTTFFIDPYTVDRKHYRVYSRSALGDRGADFECLTEQNIDLSSLNDENFQGEEAIDDKKLRKYRLALSCNAEYGNLFAGSGTDAQKKANILAQMNVTMTRVNGVYERDLAITLELVPNNDVIIYYGSTSADPWANEFNAKTQQVIDANIGNANYDIGHNFNTSGGGNAGCIGCVCQTGNKGSGYTGRTNPTGDAFDIDYVAHEMGHQFGGYHIMNTCNRGGNGATEVEPASGSSIMGYAGICSSNVQPNSDDYFNYVNIRDISANIKSGVSAGCAQIIDIANNPPTANAGPDYTIPKSTAFVLRGQGTDPDGDALTYTWEQNDPEKAPSNGAPEPTWAQGPMFRSRKGTTSPDRFMPQTSDVIAGNLAPTWEVIPSVARTMEFALTVRDNKAGGGQTADDLMSVTVNGSAGPFTVSAPNTSVTWNAGQNQTVTWNVSGTNSSPVNCVNVNILLSTDGGFTYPVTLVANTPNDGSQAIVVPNTVASTCRIKVEAADNIFYDISNTNFTISGAVSCNATVPTGLSASNIAASSATLTWNAVSGAAYDLRFRSVGTSTWSSIAAGSNAANLSGLVAATSYEAQVRSKCASDTSAYSASVTFTTTSPSASYCASNGNNTSDEYIGRVQLGAIDNGSGASTGGYGNFTSLSTNLALNSLNTIVITPVWPGTIYNEGYGVWIDYNQDGDFIDADEQVFTQSASSTTPVTANFTVPGSALTGATRMRVSLRYEATPVSCGSFNYGEVEDYTVNITEGATGGCSDLTLTLKLDNFPEETSWTIRDDAGATILSGGTYGSSPNGATITAAECLPAGCYTFTINDAYGDGICCSYGNGNYSLKDASGNILASGGSFGSSEATQFCINQAARTSQSEIPVTTRSTTQKIVPGLVYPNPVKDYLNISTSRESTGNVKITSASGALIRNIKIEKQRVDVSSLPTGVYFISIETEKAVIVKKFIKE